MENPEPDSVTMLPPDAGPTIGAVASNVGVLYENTRNILSFLPSIETTVSLKMLIPLFALQNMEDSLDQNEPLQAVPPMRASTVGNALPRPCPYMVTETEPVVGTFMLVAPLRKLAD
jgi:hypothetical protein